MPVRIFSSLILMLQDWMIPADLAPGDMKSLERDWSGIELQCIKSPDEPGFDAAFGALWAEFGANSEVEPADGFVKTPVVECFPTFRGLRPSLPTDSA